MWIKILLGILAFVSGIAANLISGWIQNDLWSNLFTRTRIIITILVAGVCLLGGLYIQDSITSDLPAPTNAVNQIDHSDHNEISVSGNNYGVIQQTNENNTLNVYNPTATPEPPPTATPLPFEPAASDEILIIIAKFYLAEGIADAEHQEHIYNRIVEAGNELGINKLRVEKLPQKLRSNDREKARDLGKQYNASIVIWGEEYSTQINVHFVDIRNSKASGSEIDITEGEKVYISALSRPRPYIDFINIELPEQLSFLSLFAIGRAQFANYQFVQAREIIKNAIVSLSDQKSQHIFAALKEAHLTLGYIHQTRDEFSFALDEHNIVVQMAPTQSEAYMARGSTYLLVGLWQKALADFNLAVQLAPESASAFFALSIGYQEIRDFNNGLANIALTIELDPKYVDAYMLKGDIYRKLNDYDKAFESYTQAINANPRIADAYLRRGDLQFAIHRNESAFNDYKAAIMVEPNLFISYLHRGQIYFNLNKIAEAFNDYERAIELNRTYAQSYYVRAAAYKATQNYEKALLDYDQAIDIDPEFLPVYIDRGNTHVILKHYDQAIADYKRAIQLDPEFGVPFISIGTAYMQQGMEDKATDSYRTALEIDPLLAAKMTHPAVAQTIQNIAKNMITDESEDIRNSSGDILAYYKRGCAYIAVGNIESAIADLTYVLNSEPLNSRALFNRASAYLSIQRFRDAVRDYEKFLALIPYAPNHQAIAKEVTLVFKDFQN